MYDGSYLECTLYFDADKEIDRSDDKLPTET